MCARQCCCPPKNAARDACRLERACGAEAQAEPAGVPMLGKAVPVKSHTVAIPEPRREALRLPPMLAARDFIAPPPDPPPRPSL